jgi:hypothetical protein
MNRYSLLLTVALLGIVLSLLPAEAQVSVTIPGSANPWLAGMPDGTIADAGDRAPDQSPVLVPIELPTGMWIEFFHVVGSVKFDPNPVTSSGPEGIADSITSHRAGNEYGKSDLVAPVNSLVGVFLDDSMPSGATPDRLDFSTAESRDYSVLTPELRQTFFIGNGYTSAGIQQKIMISVGATRLFLGTMDGFEWKDNGGSFSASVRAIPAPGSLAVGLAGMIPGLFLLLRRRRFQ